MKQIKLVPDYGCQPLWWLNGEPNEIDPQTLPLKAKTQARLRQWAETYNAILNLADPIASAFPSVEAENSFEREGIRLWQKLRHELATEYEVFYYSYKIGQLLCSYTELPTPFLQAIGLPSEAHPSHWVEATFDGQVFRPMQPISLKPNSYVRLAIKIPNGSFRPGWQEAMDGDTMPISELWDGIETSSD